MKTYEKTVKKLHKAYTKSTTRLPPSLLAELLSSPIRTLLLQNSRPHWPFLPDNTFPADGLIGDTAGILLNAINSLQDETLQNPALIWLALNREAREAVHNLLLLWLAGADIEAGAASVYRENKLPAGEAARLLLTFCLRCHHLHTVLPLSHYDICQMIRQKGLSEISADESEAVYLERGLNRLPLTERGVCKAGKWEKLLDMPNNGKTHPFWRFKGG